MVRQNALARLRLLLLSPRRMLLQAPKCTLNRLAPTGTLLRNLIALVSAFPNPVRNTSPLTFLMMMHHNADHNG